VLGLILSGIMVSSLFSAATSYIKLVADPSDQLPAITYWLMGSLSGRHGRPFRWCSSRWRRG
jgi:iron complex transport system permease protein